MFGRRSTRPDDAPGLPGVSSGAITADSADMSTLTAPRDADEAIEEHLERIKDEDDWAKSHTILIVKYNLSSIGFWLLVSASLAFATLNAFHGYYSSGGTAEALTLTAVAIGFIYFVVELTVPVSAHLMSWSSPDRLRYMVRFIGAITYVLGVLFSLTILQGKFASGADTAEATAETAAQLYTGDSEDLKAARERVKALRTRVGARTKDSIMVDMSTLLAKPTVNKRTVGDATDDCQGTRKTTFEKETCAEFDKLRRLHADAVALEQAEGEAAGYKGSLSDVSNGKKTVRKNASADDQVIASLLRIDLKDIKTFKASAIAMIAALLTHLLWAAHGMTVNSFISQKRDGMMRRQQLGRARTRSGQRVQAEAARTTAQFASAIGLTQNVAKAAIAAPMNEQPAAVQLQSFYTTCCLMGEGFSARIGQLHDAYMVWCRDGNHTPLRIDRFVSLTKQIGLEVMHDGNVIGVTLKV